MLSFYNYFNINKSNFLTENNIFESIEEYKFNKPRNIKKKKQIVKTVNVNGKKTRITFIQGENNIIYPVKIQNLNKKIDNKKEKNKEDANLQKLDKHSSDTSK